MSKFFDLFPTTLYRQSGNKYYSSYDNITNIMFRVGLIQKTIDNIASYTKYNIKDGDTPETLADKFYKDPEAHWVILYANNIYNPYKDWPMDQRTFNAYLVDKYGSIEYAQSNYHHYEKVVRRTNDNVITETRFEIDRTMESFDPNGVAPYDRWDGLEYSYQAINFGETSLTTTETETTGQTIIEEIDKDAITIFDWESLQNENKRLIKVIKKEYYGAIIQEFDKMTRNARNPFVRKLI